MQSQHSDSVHSGVHELVRDKTDQTFVLRYSVQLLAIRRKFTRVFLTMLVAGLLLVSTAWGTNSSNLLPTPAGSMVASKTAVESTTEAADGANAEVCITSNYAPDGSETYFWNLPGGSYSEIGLRFTACDLMTLKSLSFYVFDAGGGTFGNNTIALKFYSDAAGLPGVVQGSLLLPPGSYSAYPVLTTVDLSFLSLVLSGDFHVVFASDGGIDDYECLLSDNGKMGVGRTSFMQSGNWIPGLNGGNDYNFLAWVELCHICPDKGGLSDFASAISAPTSFNGAFRADAAGPQATPVRFRTLWLDQVWFRDPGDWLTPGEVFVRGTVGKAFDPGGGNTGFTYPEDKLAPWKIRHARNKCSDNDCGWNSDVCRWYNIHRMIYRDGPIPITTPPDAIDVQLEFTDYDQKIGPWLTAFTSAIGTAFACVGAFSGLPLTLSAVTICTSSMVSTFGLFSAAAGQAYDQNSERIGTSRQSLAGTSPGCFNFAIAETPDGDPARIEFLWDISVQKNGAPSLQGNEWKAPIATRTKINEINRYFYAQANGAEARFDVSVGPASLANPTLSSSLRDPEIYGTGNPFTREFVFYVDADNNKATGDDKWPGCGGDFKLRVLQNSDGNAIVLDTSIYEWTLDCCILGGPTWVLKTSASAVPYGVFIGNFGVVMTALLSEIGSPTSSWSSWVVLYENGEVVSTAPENVCSELMQITTQGDMECPTADFDVYDPGTDEFTVTFSEPMTPIVMSNIQLTPLVSYSVYMSAMNRTVHVSGAPSFAPGRYNLAFVSGQVKDVAGNSLKGNQDHNYECGDPVAFEFCVNDDHFYATDASGVMKREFGEGEHIYLTGQNFVSGAQFDVYLVLEEMEFGSKFVDQSSDGRNLVTATGGNLNAVDLGTALRPGEYSIAADLNSDGLYDQADRIAGICDPGVVVGDPCDHGIDDLVAMYPFDEVTAASGVADAVAGNHGTTQGGPIGSIGEVGGAFSFDGIDDYISVGDDEILDIPASGTEGIGDFSFEAWIQTNNATGLQIVAEKSDGLRGYSFYLDNGRLAIKIGDGSNSSWTSSAPQVSDGAWHHVGCSVDRDSPNGLKFYVDGAQTDDFDPTGRSGSLENSVQLSIGTHSTSVADLFSGKLDELSLYERALAPAEFYYVWSNGPQGKCGGDSVSVCYATGDINGDNIPLSVSDLVFLKAFILQDGPSPPFVSEADFNGDCVVDTVDIAMLQCFFINGIACLPGYPRQTCCHPSVVHVDFVPGDADGNSVITISDAVFLIQYIFAGGPSPNPPSSGDADCSGVLTISDVVYLINYIFAGGPAPCATLAAGLLESSGSIERDLSKLPSASISLSGVGKVEGRFEVDLCSYIDVAGVQLEFRMTPVQAAQLTSRTTNRSSGLQVFSGYVEGHYKVGLVDVSGKNEIAAGEGPIVAFDFNGVPFDLYLNNAVVCDRQAREMSLRIDRTEKTPSLPTQFELNQNYPNPFNPSTEISFSLPTAGEIRLEVLNMLGQVVKNLSSGLFTAGNHKTTWDGTNSKGESVASGIYFYRLSAQDFSTSKKMMLLK